MVIPAFQARNPNTYVVATLDGAPAAAVLSMFRLPNGAPVVGDQVIVFSNDRWPTVWVAVFNKGCFLWGKTIPRGAVRDFISERRFPDDGRRQDVAA